MNQKVPNSCQLCYVSYVPNTIQKPGRFRACYPFRWIASRRRRWWAISGQSPFAPLSRPGTSKKPAENIQNKTWAKTYLKRNKTHFITVFNKCPSTFRQQEMRCEIGALHNPPLKPNNTVVSFSSWSIRWWYSLAAWHVFIWCPSLNVLNTSRQSTVYIKYNGFRWNFLRLAMTLQPKYVFLNGAWPYAAPTIIPTCFFEKRRRHSLLAKQAIATF